MALDLYGNEIPEPEAEADPQAEAAAEGDAENEAEIVAEPEAPAFAEAEIVAEPEAPAAIAPVTASVAPTQGASDVSTSAQDPAVSPTEGASGARLDAQRVFNETETSLKTLVGTADTKRAEAGSGREGCNCVQALHSQGMQLLILATALRANQSAIAQHLAALNTRFGLEVVASAPIENFGLGVSCAIIPC